MPQNCACWWVTQYFAVVLTSSSINNWTLIKLFYTILLQYFSLPETGDPYKWTTHPYEDTGKTFFDELWTFIISYFTSNWQFSIGAGCTIQFRVVHVYTIVATRIVKIKFVYFFHQFSQLFIMHTYEWYHFYFEELYLIPAACFLNDILLDRIYINSTYSN